MPTPDLAIKMAAWEAIAHVHCTTAASSSRAFQFYPSCYRTGGDTKFYSCHGETDLSIAPLVSFLVGQHELFIEVIEELSITR